MKSMKIVQSDPEIPSDVLATSIVRICDSLAKWEHSGMNRRALIALIQDTSKVSRKDIVAVLDAIQSLKKNYCTLVAPKQKS